jgi:hypothetical protein
MDEVSEHYEAAWKEILMRAVTEQMVVDKLPLHKRIDPKRRRRVICLRSEAHKRIGRLPVNARLGYVVVCIL